MSVLVSKRKPSSAEFIHKAMELLEHTIKYADFKHFNKSDKDIVWKVRDLAMNVSIEVDKANSIFAKSKQDIEVRKQHFNLALGNIDALCTLLSVIHYSLQNRVTDYGWLHWGDLINIEIKLIKGVIEADSKATF